MKIRRTVGNHLRVAAARRLALVHIHRGIFFFLSRDCFVTMSTTVSMLVSRSVAAASMRGRRSLCGTAVPTTTTTTSLGRTNRAAPARAAASAGDAEYKAQLSHALRTVDFSGDATKETPPAAAATTTIKAEEKPAPPPPPPPPPPPLPAMTLWTTPFRALSPRSSAWPRESS